MLRIHFTAADLLRLRFAAEPAPLLELGLALATLTRRGVDPAFARWRRAAARGLPVRARPLLELVPPNGAGPLFLDPISDGVEDGLQEVLRSPIAFVRRELERVCGAGQPITPWLRRLADGDRESWLELETAMRAAYRAVVAGSWGRVRAGFRAEAAWRTGQWSRLGIGAGLESLMPGSRMREAVWELRGARSKEVRLEGRGLSLYPSSFWSGAPLFGTHPDGSVLMVYPALTPLPLLDETGDGDPLTALLGRTRAAVLRALSEEQTTGRLAHGLGISLASASEHVRTLREAGLAATHRDGKSAWHVCTLLGNELAGQPRARRGEPRRTLLQT